jgi:hypothetical protein
VWLGGAGEICCAQPVTARRKRAGRRFAGSRIRKLRDSQQDLNTG